MPAIANVLTGLRLISAPFVGWLVLRHQFGAALLVCLLASLTDWLDGFVARSTGTVSRLGTYLDPAADKTLLTTVFLSLGWVGEIPLWLVCLVVGRDLIIVLGCWALWRYRHRSDFRPVWIGKVSTFLQIITVLVILLSFSSSSSSLDLLRKICFLATAFFTALSGAAYIRKGIRMASTGNVGASSSI